jgi:cytoskeletal protein RodZ
MPTVAEQLRAAREAKNLSVNEVAEITKIRTDHIRALEEGNFDVFVAPVYIRGFARTYATLLKLDVPVLIKALDAELHKTEKFAEPPPLTDDQKGALDFVTLQLSKVNLKQGLIILGGLALVLTIVLSVWASRKRYNEDALKQVPPAKYSTTNKNAGEKLPLPSPSSTPRKP